MVIHTLTSNTGSSTVQSDGFVGCLRKMRVNGELVDMAAMAETAKDVHAGCVGQCSTEPCLNGGMCIEKYDTVDCQCDDTAFGGAYCSVGKFNRNIVSRQYKVILFLCLLLLVLLEGKGG